MYSEQQLASRAQRLELAGAEQVRTRREYYSKTDQNLAAAGLISADSRSHPSTRVRTNAGLSNVKVKDTAPRRSKVYQVLPFRWLNLDKHPSRSLKHITPGLDHNSTTGSPTSADRRSLSRGNVDLSLRTQPQHHSSDMLGTKGTTRRERTFVGSICAACEEPLEHVLRGERILQLSCGHVSHEACFYEYIKEFEVQDCPSCNEPLGVDSSRGGNIDFDNLNKLVRSAQPPDLRDHAEEVDSTPEPWERKVVRRASLGSQLPTPPKPLRDQFLPDQDRLTDRLYEQYTSPQRSYGGSASNETGAISSNEYPESQQLGSRRHDYDVQSMEASVISPQQIARKPIPPPRVTVRSEFPTLTKSRQQQSLTCLVTVEVVDGKWQASAHDPQVPLRSSSIREERLERPRRLRAVSEQTRAVDSVHEDTGLQRAREDLLRRVDYWHGLDVERFGKLLLHGVVRVGKDRESWQELESYLFSEMLICVKQKKQGLKGGQTWNNAEGPSTMARYTVKGSILVRKHLNQVEVSAEGDVLTLHLTVAELPKFHLLFRNREQMEVWRKALANITHPEPLSPVYHEYDHASLEGNDHNSKGMRRVPSIQSSHGNRSQGTASTGHASSHSGAQDPRSSISLHVPVDIVVVVPVAPSMQGLKVNVLRDSLRFLVSNLGDCDRMGLVTFGSSSGAVPLVGMTTKNWAGWKKAIGSIRPLGTKNIRADVVDGANTAVDLLMQRRSCNQLSHIVLISDSSTSDQDSVDFVVARAEAAKIGIHSFGLGLTHKPDAMVAMSTKTKASYTYVKDWMMLRESLAGCLGSLQSISHQNAKVKLRLPEGSHARFIKISGALQITKRATGRDAEASLGDLRFGDKRDLLVQIAIQPESSTPDCNPTDPWESMISGLEALGPIEQDDTQTEEDTRTVSVEELPLLQADLVWGDLLREGTVTQLPRPSLLAITTLPPSSRKSALGPLSLHIPPHPSVVQRRMELLTCDMLSRALGLVARGQNDRAQHLLAETRSILKGLGKGGLPPLPSPPPTSNPPPIPRRADSARISSDDLGFPAPPTGRRSTSPNTQDSRVPETPTSRVIDSATKTALDSELESSLEWICHPTVFTRDTRKSVLQAIGVISSQRGYTFRTPSETLWAHSIPGIRRLIDNSLEWRQISEDETLQEVSEPTTSTGSFPTYH